MLFVLKLEKITIWFFVSFFAFLSCANTEFNNLCDPNSRSYGGTFILLGLLGEKKHPCFPGIRIVTNPGLNINTYSGSLSESGGNASQGSSITFESFLGSAPKDTVSVQVIVSNPSYATVSPTSFVWTPNDWEVSKNITITAVNDTIINGTRNITIKLSPTSNDTSMRLQEQTISMEILDNDKIIFTSASVTPITLGGISGADAWCQADAKCPSGKICKALMVDFGSNLRKASQTANLGDGQIDWVLKPFSTYVRNDSPTVISTATNNALFTFPIVGIRPTSSTIWTGLSADWTSHTTNHCGSWALNSGNGQAGDAAGTGTSAIALSGFTCTSSLPLYCVEQ